MLKKERDSKFVIYQVLYIFVITVLALKGADLDLRRVVTKDKVVDVSVRDSLLALIDSLYAQGLNFKIEIDPNIEVENVELKQRLASLNNKVQDLTQKIKEIPPDERIPEKEPELEQTLMQLPISVTQTFIQHTWNKANNTGNVPTLIYDPRNMNTPLATVPPGQEKTFDLTDQIEVIAKFGTREQKIKVVRNKPPEIKIERVTTKMSGSDIYVRDLQRVTAFTVTIIDERPDQIKVSYTGPISVTGPIKDAKGNPVYNVSLNIASTENKFEEWLDRHGDLLEPDGRYKANFFFTAVDERSKDRVQIGDSFFFTDFSK
jgi:hypothetical protein